MFENLEGYGFLFVFLCVCLGFGRMGRSVARAILRSKDALLVAINDPFVRINDMVSLSTLSVD